MIWGKVKTPSSQGRASQRLTSNSQQMCLRCRNVSLSSHTKHASKAVASTSAAARSVHGKIASNIGAVMLPNLNRATSYLDSQSWKPLTRSLIRISLTRSLNISLYQPPILSQRSVPALPSGGAKLHSDFNGKWKMSVPQTLSLWFWSQSSLIFKLCGVLLKRNLQWLTADVVLSVLSAAQLWLPLDSVPRRERKGSHEFYVRTNAAHISGILSAAILRQHSQMRMQKNSLYTYIDRWWVQAWC